MADSAYSQPGGESGSDLAVRDAAEFVTLAI
jgi:hypothetical protein